MPKILSKIRARDLLKYNMKVTRYISEQKKLSENGYSKLQIDNLMFTRASIHGVRALLKHHDELITQFTHDMLFFVAHSGGRKSIEALQRHFRTLISPPFNFTCNQIVAMAGQSGGSLNLAAVMRHCDTLIAHRFSQEQIVSIVKYPGGSRNIEAVSSHYDSLTTFGFKRRHIVDMVSYERGANILREITQYCEALTYYNLTLAHISKILPIGGEIPVLKELLGLCQALHEMEHSSDEILGIFLSGGMAGMRQSLSLTNLAALAAPQAANKRRWDDAGLPDLMSSLSGGGFFAPARAADSPTPPEGQIPVPTLTGGDLDYFDKIYAI